MRQQASVSSTNTVSHWCLLTTVSSPRYTKMIVSHTDAIIFMKYLSVVCDFCEMFASTYFFIVNPHTVHLQRASKHNANPDSSSVADQYSD